MISYHRIGNTLNISRMQTISHITMVYAEEKETLKLSGKPTENNCQVSFVISFR